MAVKQEAARSAAANRPECTCNPQQLNHFQVVVQECKRHPKPERGYRTPDQVLYDQQFDEQYTKRRNGWLYQRQVAMEKAEGIVARAKAKAAAEGKPCTFQDVRRMAGIPDLEARSVGRIGLPPLRSFRDANRDMRHERDVARAEFMDAPPGFNGDAFDAMREHRRLGNLAASLPETREATAEFLYLTDLGNWCFQNREAGRAEYEAADRGFRAAQRARLPAPDPYEGMEPEGEELPE